MKSIQQCRLIVICADACIPDDKLIKQTVFIEELGWVPVTHLRTQKYVVVDIDCAENFFAAFSTLRRSLRILPFYEVGEFTLRSIMSQWQKQINMQLFLIVSACWCRFDAPAWHTHVTPTSHGREVRTPLLRDLACKSCYMKSIMWSAHQWVVTENENSPHRTSVDPIIPHGNLANRATTDISYFRWLNERNATDILYFRWLKLAN